MRRSISLAALCGTLAACSSGSGTTSDGGRGGAGAIGASGGSGGSTGGGGSTGSGGTTTGGTTGRQRDWDRRRDRDGRRRRAGPPPAAGQRDRDRRLDRDGWRRRWRDHRHGGSDRKGWCDWHRWHDRCRRGVGHGWTGRRRGRRDCGMRGLEPGPDPRGPRSARAAMVQGQHSVRRHARREHQRRLLLPLEHAQAGAALHGRRRRLHRDRVRQSGLVLGRQLVQRSARRGRLPHSRRPLASQPDVHGRLHHLLGEGCRGGGEPHATASGSPPRPISATWSPATPRCSRPT